MKRNEHIYPSGLVGVDWSARCPECGASVTVKNSTLAHAWEVAHRRHGCGRLLHVDETGRGWEPLAPVYG